MKANYRDLTAKYKGLRLKPDSIYNSRVIRTFFNKFIKKGNKAFAYKSLFSALANFRLTVFKPRISNSIFYLLKRLQTPFVLVSRRQAKQLLDIPVPVRRNKHNYVAINSIYKSVTSRRENLFSQRLNNEFEELTISNNQSATLRQRNAFLVKTYDDRLNMDLRWK